MSKQNYFELEVFNSMYEDENSIIKQIEKIKEKGFTYVIAPFTERGAEILVKNTDGLIVYIPTVNKNKVDNSPSNIFFGGIDYKKQISELLKYSNEKIAYFSDDSFLSNSLNDMLKENTQQIIYSKNINSSKINFKRLFKNNKLLKNSSIFMNIPLVKTSLIASQLRYYEIQPYAVLSTQINYNPMLLTLTQYDDRKNFFIANSIGKTTVSMEELNSIFGNDIVYDWVNYSTSLGIDYFYNTYFMEKSESFFQESMNDGQVEYSISIVQPKRYSFEKIIF
jgi:SRSO17 transposase